VLNKKPVNPNQEYVMKRSLLVLALLSLAACASRSVLPSVKEVKVSREAPSSKCKEMGKITGRTGTTKGTDQQALDDLKNEAAHKGANYVVVKEYSDYGTEVTGIAYECP
jgi:hypothetical protein